MTRQGARRADIDRATRAGNIKSPLRLVYLSPTFPAVRHGFEAYELQALQQRIDVRVISLRKPTRSEREWLARGFPRLRGLPVSSITRSEVLAAVAWAIVCRPRALAGVMGEFVRLARFDLRGTAKAILGGTLGCAVARRCNRLGADWIHADFASAPATAALVAARLSETPWSFMGHARDVFSTQPAGRATRPLLALKIRSATTVFSENSACQRTLDGIAVEFGTPRRSRLRRNGIVVRAEEPAPETDDRFTVVGLGALIPKKGFDTLIEAIAQARAEIPRIQLEIHGEGPERRRLHQLAAELGVGLRLEGAFSHDRLPKILGRASIVALPSRRLPDGDSDGVPTVLIEALAHRRPVVATPVGSIADLVRDGETGLVVPPDDSQALARALVWASTHRADCERLAQQGADLVAREFTAEAACLTFLEEVEEHLDMRS